MLVYLMKIHRWQMSIWKIFHIVWHKEKCKRKWDTTTHIARKAKIQNTGNTKHSGNVKHENSHSLFVEEFNALWKVLLVVSQKTQTYFYHKTHDSGSLCYFKGVENLCAYKNLHTDVYKAFIHNSQNLGLTEMSFSGWIDSCGTSGNGIWLSYQAIKRHGKSLVYY